MTDTAIQLAGIVTVITLAVIAIRPAWRLPALAFGLLAIPGNVDNLFPQMTLDLHDLLNTTAPAISSLDLLLAWSVMLTIRERRQIGAAGSRVVLIGVAVAVVVAIAALEAVSTGVEPLAAVRGIILFARVPAYLYLALALRSELADLTPMLVGIVAGGLVLTGNAAYITLQGDFDRFTAATFGRNGLAVALVIVCISSAGVAYDVWPRGGRWRPAAAAAAAAGAVALFTMLGSGTRMSLLLLLGATAFAAIVAVLRAKRQYLAGALVTGVVVVAAVAGAVAWTSAGGRTVSIITGAGDTVGEVITGATNPGESPVDSTVMSRTQFWGLAVEMIRSDPAFGVGPFQWNIERYRFDPRSPVVVVDVHNSYLQTGAEYGLPALLAYGALYLGAVAFILFLVFLRRHQGRLTWGQTALSLAACAMPVADLTNSHLFNTRMGAVTWVLVAASVAVLSFGRPEGGHEAGAHQASVIVPPSDA